MEKIIIISFYNQIAKPENKKPQRYTSIPVSSILDINCNPSRKEVCISLKESGGEDVPYHVIQAESPEQAKNIFDQINNHFSDFDNKILNIKSIGY